jgi:membrane protease YdiL (CAAX protease family)
MVGAVSTVALTGLVWQAVMPLAILALAGIAYLRPELGSVRQPFGRIPLLSTAVCGAVTPGALVLWLQVTHTDIGDLVRMVPHARLPLLVLGGAGFALINAFFEELIWRGIFQTRLVQLFPAPLAIAIQAASFGIAHAHGFPRGLVGMILAGVWGAMLGVLRQRAHGLAAPVLAHIVADATIACLVISAAR